MLTRILLFRNPNFHLGLTLKRDLLLTISLILFLFSLASKVCFIEKARCETLVVPDDYLTIQDAINVAAEGDIIFVKKGTYQIPTNQTLMISKSISLIGEEADNTVISLNPGYNVTYILTTPFFNLKDAIIVEADDVTLSGFTIDISSPGGYISVTGDRNKIIGNNLETGGSTTGLNLSGSHCNVTDNAGGVKFNIEGSFNNVVRNLCYGIFVDGDLNTFSNNSCTYINLGHNAPSLYNIIYGNKVESKARDYSGISMETSAHNVFYANYISGFSFGVRLDSLSENNTFYHNNFANNDLLQVSADTNADSNFWDNGREGNYWDDYNGTDSNRDGIGDTPYVINGANIDNYPLLAPYDIERDVTVLSPEPSPIILVATVLMVAVISVGLLVYFKKRKR
jgi:nitrous oxidase accessory protein